MSDQPDGTDSVIVGGDDVIDRIWVTVGVYHRNDRDTQLIRLSHRSGFAIYVNHKQQIRELAHLLNAAESLIQLLDLPLLLQGLLLCQQLEVASLATRLETVEIVDPLSDCLPVGQCSTQPAEIDVGHAAPLSLSSDGGLSLAFCADEENGASSCDGVLNQIADRLEHTECLLKIDDVHPFPLSEDIGGHLGMPAPGTMSEVHARFQECLQRNVSHYWGNLLLTVFPPPPSFLWETKVAGPSARSRWSRGVCVY